jgi:hypothetical protein
VVVDSCLVPAIKFLHPFMEAPSTPGCSAEHHTHSRTAPTRMEDGVGGAARSRACIPISQTRRRVHSLCGSLLPLSCEHVLRSELRRRPCEWVPRGVAVLRPVRAARPAHRANASQFCCRVARHGSGACQNFYL